MTNDMLIPSLELVSGPRELDTELLASSVESSWTVDPDATPAENVIEFAGRICYMSFGERQSPRTNSQYIRNLIEQGHESVLEHACWTILASNVTRAFTHQFVRHRIGFSYSQLSQQYVDQVDIPYLPTGSLDSPELEAELEQLLGRLRGVYRNLILSSEAKGKEQNRRIMSLARNLLPNGIATRIVFTLNARSARGFLKKRGAIEGDVEMRLFSSALLELLKQECPSAFYDFVIEEHTDGGPIVLQRSP